ncbi:unnamed protein product [Alternaria burnsii]|nr:unnamed protein product [Alternaria burnsii]
MEHTNMANSSLHQQLHQQFGQGLGNNGGGPPGDRQDDKSQRGHYADGIRPTDFMTVMKDAGVKHFHTRCMMCGETATSHHRKTWRKCLGRCPFNATHTHTGQLCPDLLRVANEDWCIAHLGESMKAERDTARGPEMLQRSEQRREQRRESQRERRQEAPGIPSLHRQAPAAPPPLSYAVPPQFGHAALPQGNWQTNRSPYLDKRRSSFGEPLVGYYKPSPVESYASGAYAAGYGTVPEAEHGHQGGYADLRYPSDGGRYPKPAGRGRSQDIRERSPPRDLPHNNYRDRTSRPSYTRDSRGPPSGDTPAERLAKLRQERVVESSPPTSAAQPLATQPPYHQGGSDNQMLQAFERRFQDQERRHEEELRVLRDQIARQQQDLARQQHDHAQLVSQLSSTLRNGILPAAAVPAQATRRPSRPRHS